MKNSYRIDLIFEPSLHKVNGNISSKHYIKTSQLIKINNLPSCFTRSNKKRERTREKSAQFRNIQ